MDHSDCAACWPLLPPENDFSRVSFYVKKDHRVSCKSDFSFLVEANFQCSVKRTDYFRTHGTRSNTHIRETAAQNVDTGNVKLKRMY